VIAISFGDIFYNNCIKNGILPIRLPEDAAASLRRQLHAHPGATLTVDLPSQQVIDVEGHVYRFDIDPFSKTCLVEGLSQIKLTLHHSDAIDAFERRYRETVTWV
jgi:3-isopropylmalate/(R)-2-methylmalate dehydratase small subunit